MYPRKDESTGRYGFWGRDDWVIAPEFEYASAFINGYAAIRLVDGSDGLIGTDGTIHSVAAICGGRTPIREEFSSFTGFDSLHGQPSRSTPIRTGNRWRREWGLIDTSLAYRPLTHKAFSRATTLRISGEYVVLIRDGRRPGDSIQGLFNLRDASLELPFEYSCIYPSLGSIWAVASPFDRRSKSNRFAFYDLNRRAFLPGRFAGAKPFSEGFGAIQREDNAPWCFVDEGPQPVFDAEFDGVERFSQGLAAVFDEDASYIDTAGQKRLVLPYEDLQPFNEFGLAIANRDGLDWDLDIIDRTGQPRLNGFETAVFWEGDFPHFEVTTDDLIHLYGMQCQLI